MHTAITSRPIRRKDEPLNKFSALSPLECNLGSERDQAERSTMFFNRDLIRSVVGP